MFDLEQIRTDKRRKFFSFYCINNKHFIKEHFTWNMLHRSELELWLVVTQRQLLLVVLIQSWRGRARHAWKHLLLKDWRCLGVAVLGAIRSWNAPSQQIQTGFTLFGKSCFFKWCITLPFSWWSQLGLWLLLHALSQVWLFHLLLQNWDRIFVNHRGLLRLQKCMILRIGTDLTACHIAHRAALVTAKSALISYASMVALVLLTLRSRSACILLGVIWVIIGSRSDHWLGLGCLDWRDFRGRGSNSVLELVVDVFAVEPSWGE